MTAPASPAAEERPFLRATVRDLAIRCLEAQEAQDEAGVRLVMDEVAARQRREPGFHSYLFAPEYREQAIKAGKPGLRTPNLDPGGYGLIDPEGRLHLREEGVAAPICDTRGPFGYWPHPNAEWGGQYCWKCQDLATEEMNRRTINKGAEGWAVLL